MIPNLMSVLDFYIEQNAFKISQDIPEQRLLLFVNIVSSKLTEWKKLHGELDQNLVGLSAIAAPVMRLMSDEDVVVSRLTNILSDS